MLDLLIQNCNALVPAETGGLTILKTCDIHIKGAQIAAIIPHPKAPAAVETIAASGQLANPSLIITHAHAPGNISSLEIAAGAKPRAFRIYGATNERI